MTSHHYGSTAWRWSDTVIMDQPIRAGLSWHGPEDSYDRTFRRPVTHNLRPNTLYQCNPSHICNSGDYGRTANRPGVRHREA
jgi:hypothetical protein